MTFLSVGLSSNIKSVATVTQTGVSYRAFGIGSVIITATLVINDTDNSGNDSSNVSVENSDPVGGTITVSVTLSRH